MNTSEKRKLVCKLLKNGKLKSINSELKPSMPSKVIYNLKGEQLEKILASGVIDWGELQDVVNRIWENSNNKSKDAKKPENNNSEKSENSDEISEDQAEQDIQDHYGSDNSFESDDLPTMLKSDNKRKYVTSDGLIDVNQLFSDLSIDKMDKLLNHHLHFLHNLQFLLI